MGAALLVLAGCGGGGSGDRPPVPQAAALRPGEIDASYGTSGRVQLAASEGFREMAAGGDGSVFVTGESILKLSPNGSVSLDYGQAGRVALFADSPVVDGGGSLHVISRGTEVVKLDPSGRFDASFGIAGRVVLGGSATPHFRADRLARDLEGNLYVAGLTRAFGPIVVSKLGPDGRIDMSFGTSGSSIPPATGFSRVEAVTVDDQLNVAIAGSLMSTGAGAPARARIIKIDRTGVPVPSFGDGGVASPALACSSTYLRALAPLPSGELIWGGSCLVPNLPLRATLRKVDRSGNDIASFRDGGFTLFGPTTPGGFVVESQWVTALLRSAGGSLYAAGQRRGGLICVQGAVTKLDANGNALPDFGFGGFVAFDELNDIRSIGMDAAGRLYLGGTHFTACNATEQPFVVARLGG